MFDQNNANKNAVINIFEQLFHFLYFKRPFLILFRKNVELKDQKSMQMIYQCIFKRNIFSSMLNNLLCRLFVCVKVLFRNDGCFIYLIRLFLSVRHYRTTICPYHINKILETQLVHMRRIPIHCQPKPSIIIFLKDDFQSNSWTGWCT